MNRHLARSTYTDVAVSLSLLAALVSASPCTGDTPLPAGWDKNIVPIEKLVVARTPTGRDSATWWTIGTGFVVVDADSHAYVVTCRHVVEGKESLFIRMRTMMEDSAPGDVLVPVACSPRRDTFNFIFHPDTSVDLALTAIQALPGIMHDYFPYDSSYVMSSDSLFPGEDVFVVGFPLGMGGERNTPIVRAGTVALTERGSREFLVDVDVFPGNSGGPVWLKPSLFNYRTNVFGEMTRPILVGVLRSYVPYEEVAYSFATGASVPRVVFTENSGLARAVSASLVLGMLNRARTRR